MAQAFGTTLCSMDSLRGAPLSKPPACHVCMQQDAWIIVEWSCCACTSKLPHYVSCHCCQSPCVEVLTWTGCCESTRHSFIARKALCLQNRLMSAHCKQMVTAMSFYHATCLTNCHDINGSGFWILTARTCHTISASSITEAWFSHIVTALRPEQHSDSKQHICPKTDAAAAATGSSVGKMACKALQLMANGTP